MGNDCRKLTFPASAGKPLGVSIVRLSGFGLQTVVAKGDFCIKDPVRGITLGEMSITIREDGVVRATDADMERDQQRVRQEARKCQ